MDDRSWRRELRSAQDACCLCLNTFKLTPMNESFNYNVKSLTYSQIMDICLSIQISDDCMLCTNCVQSLKQIWIFFSQIEATQAALRATTIIKDEPKDIDHHQKTADSFIKEEILLHDSTSDRSEVIIGNVLNSSVTHAPCDMNIKTESTEPPQLKNESISTVTSETNHTSTVSKKRKYKYHYKAEWEQEFFFTMKNDKCTCIICFSSVVAPTKGNCKIHFRAFHEQFEKNYPLGTKSRKAKVQELMTKFKLSTMSKVATMAAFQKTTISTKLPEPVQPKQEIIREYLLPSQSPNVSTLGVNGNLVYLTGIGTKGWCIINGTNHSSQLVNETYSHQNNSIEHTNVRPLFQPGMGASDRRFPRLAPAQKAILLCSNCQRIGHISDKCPNKIPVTTATPAPDMKEAEKVNVCSELKMKTSESLSNKLIQAITSSKKRSHYRYNAKWEQEFFFTMVENTCICIICYSSIAVAHKSNIQRHFTSHHKVCDIRYPLGTELRKTIVQNLIKKMKNLLINSTNTVSGPAPAPEPMSVPEREPVHVSKETAAMASLEITEHFSKHKKSFEDPEIWKESFITVGKILFQDYDNKPEIIASIKQMSFSKNSINE